MHESLRFVTIEVMTVSGKGGRPRKWRSDADRVRAYRARQRGAAEPSTLHQAFDDGDELAASIERERVSNEQLAAANQVERALRAEIATTKRSLDRHLKRVDWLEVANADLTADFASANAELHSVRHHEASPAPRQIVERPPNRAVRRRAARGHRA